MIEDGVEGKRFHDSIDSMEDSIPAILVHEEGVLSVHADGGDTGKEEDDVHE